MELHAGVERETGRQGQSAMQQRSVGSHFSKIGTCYVAEPTGRPTQQQDALLQPHDTTAYDTYCAPRSRPIHAEAPLFPPVQLGVGRDALRAAALCRPAVKTAESARLSLCGIGGSQVEAVGLS